MSTTIIETESQWFKIAVLIIAVIIIIVCAYNVNSYRKLSAAKQNIVSTDEANTLLIINIIFLVLGVVLFIWALWRLVFAADYRQYLVQSTQEKVSGLPTKAKEYLTSTTSGINLKPSTTTTVTTTSVAPVVSAHAAVAPVASAHAAVAPVASAPVAKATPTLAAPAVGTGLRPLSPVYSNNHII